MNFDIGRFKTSFIKTDFNFNLFRKPCNHVWILCPKTMSFLPVSNRLQANCRIYNSYDIIWYFVNSNPQVLSLEHILYIPHYYNIMIDTIRPRNYSPERSKELLIKLSKFSSKSLSSFLVVEHSEDVWAFVIVPVQ